LATHINTRDCESCQRSVDIPFAKHLTERERKFEKCKEYLVPIQCKEKVRIKVGYVVRFCLYNCNSLFTYLLSHQFFMCTHMLSLHLTTFVMHYSKCNTLSVRTLNCLFLQRHFRDVAQTPARITDIKLSRMICAGSHPLSWNRHRLAKKKDKKSLKGQEIWVHTYPTVCSRPRGRCLKSLVYIGSEMWICIRYKQTNKQPFSYVCKITWYERVNLYNQQKMIELRKKHTQTD